MTFVETAIVLEASSYINTEAWISIRHGMHMNTLKDKHIAKLTTAVNSCQHNLG